MQRANDTELVGMAGEMRKQLTDPDSTFAMLREAEGRTEDRAQLILVAADRLTGELFSVFRVQPRLGVEQIDMTWTAPHEQEDDSPRAGRKMRCRRERTSRGLRFGRGCFGSQGRQYDLAKSAGARAEHVA